MSDRPQPRDLTPPTHEGAPQWKVVGLELAHWCTFCGCPSEAKLGCPDERAPLIFQVGVCNSCLVDCVMRRFREVKHQRFAQLAGVITAAAHGIRNARKKASWERYKRSFPGKEPDPEVEAEAARKLAEEEEGIARKFDMCPGGSYDEHQKGYRQAWRERRHQ
jgi:hypothetical protein